MSIGKKINILRKNLNLSVKQFAKTMGYSNSAMTKIIYGERQPGRKFLEKLKKKYPNVDMNIFFE